MVKPKDYRQELCDYIKRNLKKGYTMESLKWALINQGYSRIEVEKALRFVDMDLAKNAPILKTENSVPAYEVVDIPEKPKSFWQRFFGGL